MAAKLEEDSSELYERCTNAALNSPEGRAKIFGQDELLKMGVVDTAQALLELLQGLMDAQLVRLMQMDGKICYALRKKDDAAKCVLPCRPRHKKEECNADRQQTGSSPSTTTNAWSTTKSRTAAPTAPGQRRSNNAPTSTKPPSPKP